MAKNSSVYDYSKHNDARPNVGVTVVPLIYDFNERVIKVLTYRRSDTVEQFPSCISLPNGIYDRQLVSNADEAAANALRDKVRVRLPFMEQLYTFSGDYIDPGRINTINIAYWSVLRLSDVKVDKLDENSSWVAADKLLNTQKSKFAFNHKEVLEMAMQRLRSKSEYFPVALQLLPEHFTIPDFKDLTEILIGQKLNNVRFRDRIKKSNILLELEGIKRSGVSKSFQVYCANKEYVGDFYPKSIGN
jgi:8-oxo-dGTP diphosphatase